ncbi:MAG: BatD family protein [Bacteroidota bacterium]
MKNRFSNLFVSVKCWHALFMLFVMLSLIGTPVDSYGQSLTASVNRNNVGVDEQFQATFTLNGSASSFTPPNFSDFMVLSGPNQSTSMQIINGAFSQSVSYSYILQPKKTGTFKIGPASINSGGKNIQSNVVTITVTAGGQSNQGGQGGQSQGGNVSSGSVFIRVSVDKKQVYKGEAVVATFKLYANVPVVNYTVNKMPSFSGFWSQDIEMPKQMNMYQENVNGTPFQVGEIKKVVLYPQQSGTLTIDQMLGECVARIRVNRNRSNNPFDIFNDPFFNDPFFGSGGVRDVPYSIKSDPIKITVKDLPSGAPASFKGAVGDFSMETILDREKIKSNDAVNLRVKINGKGNLKLIESPVGEIPSDIESYEPKIQDNISTNAKGSAGTRTFEHLLIPRIPGNFDLGKVEFTYFNPEKSTYITLSSPTLKLQVEKGKGDGSAVAASGGKNDFRILGRDIRFIKTGDAVLSQGRSSFYGSWTFYLLAILPLGAMVFLGVFKRKQIRLRADAVAYRSKQANSMAIKRLKTAEKLLDKNELNGFYEETGKAIWTYLSDKLGIQTAELNKEQVVSALQNSGATTELSNAIIRILDTCEFARYAGSAAGTNPRSIYEETVKTITDAEKELA